MGFVCFKYSNVGQPYKVASTRLPPHGCPDEELGGDRLTVKQADLISDENENEWERTLQLINVTTRSRSGIDYEFRKI